MLITKGAVQRFRVVRDGFGGVTVPVTADDAVVHDIQLLEEVFAVQVLHGSKGTAAVGAEVFGHEGHGLFCGGLSVTDENDLEETPGSPAV